MIKLKNNTHFSVQNKHQCFHKPNALNLCYCHTIQFAVEELVFKLCYCMEDIHKMTGSIMIS